MRKLVLSGMASLVLAACAGTHPASVGSAHANGLRAQALGAMTTEKFGERTYKLFSPPGLAGKKAPLVMMLHGCTQDPDQFASGTQMNALAVKEGFHVIYPDQPRTSHPYKCWRWFDPMHQARGQGEPAILDGMVKQVAAKVAVETGSVFIAGLSAGAAMASVMGATYPDTFAAIAIGAGLEFQAATNETDGRKAMSAGGPNPVAQGALAYKAMKEAARVVPMIVFHGTTDAIVAPLNEDQVVAQWAATNDLADDGKANGSVDAKPDATEQGQVAGGKGFTKRVFNDAAGAVLMESYAITSMGHAWSGGSAAGSYTDPKGPNASELSWAFFKAHARAKRTGLK